MGNLVFQATLGGQVNLVGPNTASTFNLNVPAVAGTLVTTGDSATVTNTMLAGSIANAKLSNSSVTVGSTSIALGASATTVTGLTLTSPTFTAPVLGTPASGTLTSCTGLPLTTGVTGTLAVTNGGTGVTTSTGSGNNVLSTSPTLVTPVLGTPTSGTLTNCTGLPTSGLTGTISEANGGTGTTTGYYGFKNRIINGAMVIDQRNAGASISPTNAANGYAVDRFALYNSSASSKFSAQQSSTAPTGFSKSLLITSSSSYTVGSSELFTIAQYIEGFNTADLGFGTASASTVTLSFWVRSSLTGTFGGSLMNSAYNRSYPFSYTISSANTFEYKTITIAGDTSGTWVGATNGNGLRVNFSLGMGSTYSGTANAWASAEYYAPTGAVSVVGTSGATLYLTGVQLEKGSTATSFDYRPYGTELGLCLRYYWRLFSNGANSPIASGNAETSTRGYINLTLPQPMRTQPSCSISNISHLSLRGGATDIVCTSGSFSTSTSSAMATIIGGEFNTGSSTGATTGGCVKMDWNGSSAWIDASAEL